MARLQPLKTSVPTLGQILRRFWPLVRAQRRQITIAMLALFGEIFLRLLEPWPLKFVFDRVMSAAPAGAGGGGGAAPGTGFVNALSPGMLLALAALAVVLIAGVRAATSYVRRVGFAIAGSRVLSHCRGELFSHLQRLSLSFHSQRRTGDLTMRVTGDIGRLKEVAITAAMPMLAHVLTLLGMLVVMFWMNWHLALVALAVIPLFMLSTRRIGGRIRQVARLQRQRKGELGATAVEAIGSIKTVQSLALEDVHGATFAERNRSDLRQDVKAKRLAARLIGTTDLLIAAGTAAVLWFGAGMALRGDLTPGDLIVFLAYLKSALRPIRNLAKYSSRMAKAAASAERIIEVLETTPEIRNRPGAIEAPPLVTALGFEDVTFGYTEGQVAVEHFVLEARQGDVVVLAGPSGAGKSTVVNLLLRLYDPQAGRVRLEAHDLRDYTLESLRQRIAVVPQENVLFAVSVRDNIAYGAPGADDEQVVAAARLAQAHEFIVALPDGYDTVVGERGERLSEGQRQRIAIARAAIRAAPILVLDEPTASLDNENNRLVRAAMRTLSHDRITFIIAHDLSTVLEESHVVFLDRGRIIEQGTHEELLRRDGRYAAMYALQGRHHDVPEAAPLHALDR